MVNTLSNNEQNLLQSLQSGIPVVSRPFEQIGRDVQMEEAQVLNYLRHWKEKGFIRWLGVIFSTSSLGYQSTLVALSLPANKIAEAADIINQHPGVTHNYQRDHDYNLWFTLAVAPGENIDANLEKLAKAGKAKKWLNLPVINTYKISLILPLAEKKVQVKASGVLPSKSIYAPTEDTLQVRGTRYTGALASNRIYALTEDEKALVRILQEDWPLVSTPYALMAKEWGQSEKCLIEKIKQWKSLGIIRRLAGILRHREAGFTINWMVAWRIKEEKMDSAGRRAAQSPLVSHCYQRRVTDDWLYPLFTMVHARSEEEAKKTIEDLRQSIEPVDYKILPTIKEFKKVRLKLFINPV